MSATRNKYQVHAELLTTGVLSADFDDALAGHPMARRLNRIERVVATYLGQVDKRLGNGLQVVFETADAALLSACEMLHRCEVLPQVSGHRLALRIGIHHGVVRQRAKDGPVNTWETAAELAVADDSIVLSEIVLAALNPELRKLALPLGDIPAGSLAYKFDWRGEIPSASHGGDSVWPASKPPRPIGPYLLLNYDQMQLELSSDNPVLTIGRDPLNDLVVTGERISRNHCRIEKKPDRIALTDTSTNGTCVVPENGVQLMVKKNSVVLKGKGMLFFGRPCNGERRGGVKYETG
jgi:hypothetical protein